MPRNPISSFTQRRTRRRSISESVSPPAHHTHLLSPSAHRLHRRPRELGADFALNQATLNLVPILPSGDSLINPFTIDEETQCERAQSEETRRETQSHRSRRRCSTTSISSKRPTTEEHSPQSRKRKLETPNLFLLIASPSQLPLEAGSLSPSPKFICNFAIVVAANQPRHYL
ncbi:unnamed protein product [Linum trigynum]|uniref:Uncharacterized protein n=1 Tax=Linum trigynum TaxID=586398 RepID=A0AAV2E7P5_9ROSI